VCTIRWLTAPQGYEIFFNRDELDTRQRAIPPSIKQQQRVYYLAPTDPDGQGSWISVNQFGVTLAIMNNYRATPAARPPVWHSRGLLVEQFATINQPTALQAQLAATPLHQFKPFDLIIFSPAHSPQLFSWDGEQLGQDDQLAPPLVSSPQKNNKMVSARLRLMTDGQPLSTALLLRFHSSHEPGDSAHSVCLHRNGASTVSLSHITVTPQQVLFRYWDGSPCRTTTPYQTKLKIRPGIAATDSLPSNAP